MNKLFHESKKERAEKQTKMERALEGVVCVFSRNTAEDPILKITMSRDNTNRWEKEKKSMDISKLGKDNC